jgi:hypothetical protein
MNEAEVQGDREQWRQKQAAKQLAKLELRRARGMVAMVAEKEAMGGQMDSEKSIAKQTKDRMKELLDMELVGDNSSAELTRGQSKVPEELEQPLQTAQTAEDECMVGWTNFTVTLQFLGIPLYCRTY